MDTRGVRDYIEEHIVGRLLASRPTDREVNELYFDSLITGLQSTMERVANKYYIAGFTREDLMGFMYLKTHQMLRRGQLNTVKLPHSVFYAAYKNLMYDMIRMEANAKKRGLRTDPIDDVKNDFHQFEEGLAFVYQETHVEWRDLEFDVQ